MLNKIDPMETIKISIKLEINKWLKKNDLELIKNKYGVIYLMNLDGLLDKRFDDIDCFLDYYFENIENYTC